MQKIINALLFLVLLLLPLSFSSAADLSCISATVPVELEESFTKALENVPCELVSSLHTIEIFDDETLPRAMANARIIKVNRSALDDPELVNVLIHELGHVVDLGGLTSSEYKTPSVYTDGGQSIYEDDPSVQYYSLSWATESQKKQNTILQDFVGEYASTDMFEDFAEGFLLYIQHGNTFRKLARHNTVLAQKYAFFKNVVFKGTEFNTGSRKVAIKTRVWDITKL